MGQIAGKYDFLSRVNIRDLATLPTPAAGEYILVSSDNSMNAAGQGNFDCYIEGDGQKAATALPLHYIDNDLLEKVTIQVEDTDFTWHDGYYISSNGVVGTAASATYSSPKEVHAGDIVRMYAQGTEQGCICLTDANGSFYTVVATNNSSTGYALKEYTVLTDGYVAVCSRIVAIQTYPPVIVKSVLIKDKVVELESQVDSLSSDFNTIADGLSTQTIESDISSQFTFESGQIYISTSSGNGKYYSANTMKCNKNYVDISMYKQLRISVLQKAASNSTGGTCFYTTASENGAMQAGAILINGMSPDSLVEKIVTIPDGAKYIRTTINADDSSNGTGFFCYGLNMGSMSSVVDYVENYVGQRIIPIEESGDKIVIGGSMVDLSTLIKNHNYVTESNGSYSSGTSSAIDSYIIPVSVGDKYRVTAIVGANTPAAVGMSSSTFSTSNIVATLVSGNTDNPTYFDDVIFTIPTGVSYLFIQGRNQDHEGYNEAYALSLREVTNAKESYNTEHIDAIESQIEGSSRRYSACKSFGTQPAANGSPEFNFNASTMTYNDLITNIYEVLRTENPNYITKTSLGNDASNIYELFAYEFTPRYYQQHILLLSGIHGDEPDGIICLARIMQLITNSDGSDADLEFLRNNVRITVIPCANPWGFSQRYNRNNYNGETLQTWGSPSQAYELGLIINYLDNIMSDVSFGLSMHTTTNNNYKDFYGVIKPHAKNVRTIFRVDSWLCDHYALNGATVDDQYLGYLTNHNYHEIDYWTDVYHIPAATLELSDYHWSSSRSTSDALTMGVTMWLNFIIQQANDFYPPQTAIIDIPSSDYRESRA